MKTGLFLLAVLSLFAGSANAQKASDPNAVNIALLGRTVDTALNVSYLNNPIPVGDVDGDGVEDLFINRVVIGDDGGQKLQAYLLTKVNTEPSRVLLQLPYHVLFAADFNGDGHKDLLTIETTNEGFFNRIHWWTDENGPFNAGFNTLLMENTINTVYAQAVGDITGDGIADIVTRGGYTKLLLYKGEKDLDKLGGFRPYDSLDIENVVLSYPLAYMIGNFTPDGKGSIVLASSTWIEGDMMTAHYRLSLVTVGSEDRPLATATMANIYNDTVPNTQMVFVYSSPALVADVSGDGLDDLIASDTGHLYIWNGREGFGSTELTEQNVDQVISMPHLIDPEFAAFSSFAQIKYLGNITGTGTPFFATDIYGMGIYSFIYAGGAAMDTYFDAYLPDTLAANPQLVTISLPDGSKAIVYIHFSDSLWQVSYAREGLENIPQTKSSVRRIVAQENELHIEHVGPASIRIDSDIRGMLTVYDVLGHAVLSHRVSADAEVINVSQLSTGTYYVVLEDRDERRIGKFIR